MVSLCERVAKWFTKAKAAVTEPEMKVIGNDDVGWSAKYPDDKNYVMATKRETAIFGCRQRYLERKAK